MRVREVMTAPPVIIEENASVARALTLMRERDIRHLPVTRGGRLVGIVSERDIFLLLSLSGVDADGEPVTEAMTELPYSVSPEARLAPVAREMARHKYGSAVVVDDDGAIVGVLTTVDALRGLADLLETAASNAADGGGRT